MVELTANDNFVQSRKLLFLFPDVRTQFHPNEPRLFHYFYVSGSFLEYILQRNLFNTLYKTGEELKYFELYLRDYHFSETDISYTAIKKIPYEFLVELEKNLASRQANQFANLAFLYLNLGRQASLAGDKDKCIYYYSQLTQEKVKALFINSFNPDFAFKYVAEAVADLVKFDNIALAQRLVKSFGSTINRSSAYAYAASTL